MVRCFRASELCNIVSKHMPLEQRINVRAVTKDGADVYDWVARQSFPNATKILDKFHILK
ncbi:MAG: transposase [Saprospiraceae bacterium]|jgi:transposase